MRNYEPFNKETASRIDRIAYTLCQIIDEDAPVRWTRYRGVGKCIALNKELMKDLEDLRSDESPGYMSSSSPTAITPE